MKSPASYRNLFLKYGSDPKSLKWKSRKAAEQRYREIASLVDFEDKSVLDIGCGFGDIIPFISPSNGKLDYTGIDRVVEFIGVAAKKYPQHRFIVEDYFSKPLNKKFDVIIANGCLNSNVKNNVDFRKKAIRLMYKKAKIAVIFNMAGAYPQKKTASDSNVWFADALEILKYCLDLTPNVTFINHPGRREFSVVLLRK